MSGRLLRHVLAMCGASLCLAGPMQAASPRVTMPDWSGEWEMVGLTPNDGGLYVESPAQIAARWNQAPYSTDARQAAFRSGPERALREGNPSQSGAAPGFACSFGFPLLMLEAPATFEALVTPHQTALVFSTREVRNVYTDGRPHTAPDEIWPTYWGDSIGHWEGQTLVIETIAVNSPFQALLTSQPAAGAVVAMSGAGNGPPRIVALFSREARYTERLRLLDSGQLEDELTIDDPVALTKPWKITRQYRRIANVNRMVFQDCEGDTRHPIVNGRVELRLTQ
jgi:hypothetical protein